MYLNDLAAVLNGWGTPSSVNGSNECPNPPCPTNSSATRDIQGSKSIYSSRNEKLWLTDETIADLLWPVFDLTSKYISKLGENNNMLDYATKLKT